MRRLKSVTLTVTIFVALTTAARAQVAIYGTFSPMHVSSVDTGSVPTSSGFNFQEKTTGFWAPAFGGGVTLNFLHVGPVTLGLDLRGSTRPGTTGADTALGGIKLGFTPPVIHLKPYVQASVGYLATRTANQSTLFSNGTAIGGTFNNQYVAYEGIVGLDYPIAHLIDLRLIELGAGQGLVILGSNNANIFTVNTGVVLHF